MTSKEKQNTKKETVKFIDEARLDGDRHARDMRDYEAMLMDFIREEFEV
ncbi:MAG: hypothetical protein NC218_08430 [Acetobacter sp.]|nr:hypothetical protein [Acetobacter sp.]